MRTQESLLSNNNNAMRVRLPLDVCFYTLLLTLVGVVNIASASRLTRPSLFLMQILWIFLGVLLVLGISLVRTRSLKFIAYPFYSIVVFLLLLVLAIGTSAKGSQRWLDLGLFRMQPSELAKLCMVFATARFCTDYEIPGGYRLRDLIRPFNLSRPILFSTAIIVLLVTNKINTYLTFLGAANSTKTLLFIGGLLLVALLWFFYINPIRHNPYRYHF